MLFRFQKNPKNRVKSARKFEHNKNFWVNFKEDPDTKFFIKSSFFAYFFGTKLTLFSVGTFLRFRFRDIRLSRIEGVDSRPSPRLRSDFLLSRPSLSVVLTCAFLTIAENPKKKLKNFFKNVELHSVRHLAARRFVCSFVRHSYDVKLIWWR